MQLPIRSRSNGSALSDGSAPLELRRKRIHQHHRRALIREWVGFAFWGVGLLAITALLAILALEVTPR